MIVLDTSGLLAAIDEAQHRHAAAVAALRSASPPRVLSPFVLAELDYLLATRVGMAAQNALLDEVAAGVFQLAPFEAHDVAAAREVMDRYEGLRLGLADASVVVLAVRHRTRDILTLDERHFRALRGPGGKPFRLLPADAA